MSGLETGHHTSGKLPGKPLVLKEHWTAAFSDQLRLFAVQLLCSGGSSAIAKAVVAPLERVKILRQVQHMAIPDIRPMAPSTSTAPPAAASIATPPPPQPPTATVAPTVPTASQPTTTAVTASTSAPSSSTAPTTATTGAPGTTTAATTTPPGAARGGAVGTHSTGPEPTAPTTYSGIRDAFRRLPAREGGMQALWRGNGANVVRLLPDVAFRFVIHDQFRVMFAPMDGSPPGVAEKLAAGAATGILKTALFYPLDLCRTRITADQSVAAPGLHVAPLSQPLVAVATTAPAAPATAVGAATSPHAAPLTATSGSAPGPASAAGGGAAISGRTYPTIRSCMMGTLWSEGIRGLYRGALLSMSGVAPYLAISFTMYDELRKRLPSDRESTSAIWYPFLKMGCGAVAAVSAQTVVYPLDTVRRCMQMNGAAGQTVRYTSAGDCFMRLLRSPAGVKALYRGCLANCLKTSLGAPVHFVMYDAIKSGVQALDPTTGVASPL